MEVTIKFKNGKTVKAKMNATTFITNKKPDFPEDLSEVTVTGDGEEKVYTDAYIIECASVDGKYWFAFGEYSAAERRLMDIEDALCELSKED